MYQRSLTSMIYKLFDMSSGKLAEELHKPIIRKFEKRKVHSPFIVFDLVDMQLISKFNKIIHFYYVFLMILVSTPGLFL